MLRRIFAFVLATSTTALAGALPTATDLLARYVRIDTSNPPGVTTRAAEFWEDFFAAEGIGTKRIVLGENKPALLARIGEGKGPALVLMHHMDVVPADPEEWDVPPFAGEILDGVLYGRGVIDTKSLGVFQALAMARLVREQIPVRREIVFLGMPDEEVGATEGAIPFVENHWDEVANAEFLFNEGGSGTVGILAPETPVMNVQVAEKQVLWLDVAARGKSGHGSMPHDAQAVARLLRALHRIHRWETPRRIPPVVAETQRRISRLHGWPDRTFLAHPGAFWASPFVLDRMEEDPTTNALIRNTCSLTGLEAGKKINVMPSVARATIDCRLLPGEKTEAFLESLRDVVDDEHVEFSVRLALENSEPSSWENEAFQAIERVVASHLDDAVVTPSMSAGFTDSTHFRRKGLPCYGFNPLVLGSEQLQSIHNVNERVGVENLERADRIYTDVVRRLAKSGKLHW